MSIERAIRSTNDRGTEKLREIPIALRDMADVLEQRLAGIQLHEANYEVVLQLRNLDSHISLLQTHAEVLQWYIDINSGCVIHTTEEIQKVKDMLAEELRKKNR